MSDALNELAESLLKQKGVYSKGLDAEVLAQMKSDLADRIEDRVNAAILAYMPDDKKPMFALMLDTGALEVDIKRFLRENVKGLQPVVGAAVADFQKDYLGK